MDWRKRTIPRETMRAAARRAPWVACATRIAKACILTVLACGDGGRGTVTVETAELGPVFGDALFSNVAGHSANHSTTGYIDRDNPFFLSLGTNGRACVSCHLPEDGFTITPASARRLFNACEGAGRGHPGRDPEDTACAIFLPLDGATRPDADVSTRRTRHRAYRLLLNKGLIRIEATVPTAAEFELVAVDSPYHDEAEEQALVDRQTLFLYRRPLPATNLRFAINGVMWDLRETTTASIPPPFLPPSALVDQLASQARGATERHAEGTLTDEQLTSIVNFELSLSSAQEFVFGAGSLTSAGAMGGTNVLSELHVPSQNSNAFALSEMLGLPPFTRTVFTLFDAWTEAEGHMSAQRRSIARGQALFNQKTAPGIADNPFFNPDGVTCSDCHTSFGTGSSNVLAPLNQNRVSDVAFRSADLPLYTLRCTAKGEEGGFCTEGQLLETTDPGRGLITGQWRLLDRFKVPNLRNLSARPPYFHNGSADTLEDVVAHYEAAMGFDFTDSEARDLVSFMKAL